MFSISAYRMLVKWKNDRALYADNLYITATFFSVE